MSAQKGKDENLFVLSKLSNRNGEYQAKTLKHR